MASPLNIALISREYPPFFGGGIGSYTVRWSRVLAGAGHRVVVITASGDGRVHRERDGDITVVRFPLVRENDWSGPDPAIADRWTRAAFQTFSPVSIFAMQVAAALPELAAEFSLDVVEAPDTGALHWFTLNARRLGLAFWERSPAFVTCIHSPTAWIARWNRSPLRSTQDRALAAMEAECVRWSDGILSPSHAMRDEASALWGLEPGAIAVIPYPLGELEDIARCSAAIDADREHGQNTSAAVELSAGVARLLYAGRLEPRKGIDTLLDGLNLACRENAPIELHLAGEDMPDPDRPGPFGMNSLEWLVPKEFHRCVRLHGKLQPEALAELQREADAIVVPSPMDNFPNTCMEAMAAGKLVVAAGAGGMAEMIEHAQSGLLFRPCSPESCAEMIGWAAHMPVETRAAMGRSAAARILDLCGNQRVLRQRVEHFRSIIEAKRGRLRTRRERRAVVVLDATCAEAAPALLTDAVRSGGIDFAHGWTSRGERTHTFGSPAAASLAESDSPIGPLAVAGEALGPALLAHLKPGNTPDQYLAPSTRLIAAMLCDRGLEGAVIPSARTDLVPAEPSTMQQELASLRAAREDLQRIRSSRGWRWLSRLYRVLHVLKGRGFRERGTYDPADGAGAPGERNSRGP